MPTASVGVAHRSQDVIELIAGIWLFFTPFFVTRTPAMAAAYNNGFWNSLAVGVLFVVIAALAMSRQFASPLEWGNVALAIWLFLSPWILGFALFTTLAWTSWIVGVIVFCMALWGGASAQPPNDVPPVEGGGVS
jgi:hypothetical protein